MTYRLLNIENRNEIGSVIITISEKRKIGVIITTPYVNRYLLREYLMREDDNAIIADLTTALGINNFDVIEIR